MRSIYDSLVIVELRSNVYLIIETIIVRGQILTSEGFELNEENGSINYVNSS